MGGAKRSRTVCNTSALPPEAAICAAALSGQTCVVLEQIELSQALDCGGLAVLRDAWQRFRSEKRFADMPQVRQRRLLQTNAPSNRSRRPVALAGGLGGHRSGFDGPSHGSCAVGQGTRSKGCCWRHLCACV